MALWSWLARRRQVDQGLQEEIRSHLAIAAQERVADGADQQAARLAALKEFGNVTLTREAARRVWSTWWIETAADLLHDARYAIRVLRRSPGFSLIVIAVLAIGIGLNAAVFTIFKGLALKPLAGVDGSAGLGVVVAKTNGGRPSRCPIRTINTSGTTIGHSRDSPGRRNTSSAWGSAIAANASAANSSPGTTFSCWTCARAWAARSFRRTRSIQDSMRSLS